MTHTWWDKGQKNFMLYLKRYDTISLCSNENETGKNFNKDIRSALSEI